MTGDIERLAEAGIVLPELPAAIGSYVPYIVSGDLVFVSGQLPWADGRIAYLGRVGVEVSVEDGAAAARLCGLALVAQVRAACAGDLDRVAAVVRLGGFVACEPGFADQPKVLNGASDLMVQVFADAGRHARAAVGVSSLPLNACVEVEGCSGSALPGEQRRSRFRPCQPPSPARAPGRENADVLVMFHVKHEGEKLLGVRSLVADKGRRPEAWEREGLKREGGKREGGKREGGKREGGKREGEGRRTSLGSPPADRAREIALFAVIACTCCGHPLDPRDKPGQARG